MKRISLTVIILAMVLSIRAQSNVTQVEYFLDTDNGFGLNTIVNITSPDADITQMILANIPPSTSIGYHKLYIRAKDENGNWSQTIRKHIEITEPITQNNIVMGEYFIDQDPEYGTATSFIIDPENEDIEQAFIVQILGSATLGYHKLYGRVKDSKGNWSHTFRKNIEVYLNPVTNIVEIEYFFDGDQGFGTKDIESIGTPEEDGSWTFNVPYPSGNYNFNDALFIRVKDSNNNWSITTVLDEIKTLDIEESVLKSTIIYPNPFENELSFDFPNNTKLIKFEIYNTVGQKVYSGSGAKTTSELSHLKSGLYILYLKTNVGTASFKITKQ